MGAIKELLIEIEEVLKKQLGRDPTQDEISAVFSVCKKGVPVEVVIQDFK